MIASSTDFFCHTMSVMLLPTFASLGHGPLVMLLHGSGGNFRSFAPQLETLASLGWRAVAWDMPGYGHSVPIEPYNFKGLAERCIALLGALAPGQDVTLLGCGMGGMVAQEVVARRPDLVQRLGLVATAATVAGGTAYSGHVTRGLGWLNDGLDMDAIAARLLSQLVGPAAVPEGVRLVRFCQQETRAATWRRALEAMRDFDRREALGHIGVPTLLLAGTHDTITPPASLREMAAAIAGSRYVELKHAGHWPQLEQPDDFNEALLDFLRSAPPRYLH